MVLYSTPSRLSIILTVSASLDYQLDSQVQHIIKTGECVFLSFSQYTSMRHSWRLDAKNANQCRVHESAHSVY